MNRAVFLDRDNTIIQAEGDVADPDHVRLITGVASAIASLRGLGYRVIVISNQGGVARGDLTEAEVDAVNRRIAELVQYNSGATIDRFYYCPYHPEATVEQYRADHPWRKPSPGMLQQAAEDMKIDLAASWTVGDHRHDVAAGRAAGTRTILLQPHAPDGGYSLETAIGGEEDDAHTPHFVARSLVEAVRLIAQRPPAEKPQPRQSAAASSRPDAPAAIEGEQQDGGDESDPSTAEAEEVSGEPGRQAERPTAPTVTSTDEASESHDHPTVTLPFDEDDTDQFQHGEESGPSRRTHAVQPVVAPPPPTPRPEPREQGEEASADAEDDERQSSGIPSPPFEDIGGSSREPHLTTRRDASAPSPSPSPSPASPAVDDEPSRQPVPSGPPKGRTTADREPEPAGQPRQPGVDPTLVDVLRQIQRELKARHADYGDFSYAKMAAALCQMLAVGCVLFGMIHVGELETFARWMLGAVFAQLLVITLLVTHNQR